MSTPTFNDTLKQYNEQFDPITRKLTAFEKSMIENRFNLVVEQELPTGEEGEVAPPADALAGAEPGIPDPNIGSEIEEPELKDKPYSWMAYIAYKCLLLDPAELEGNTAFDELTEEIGDIVGKGDIKTPEMGLKIMIALNDIIEEHDVPVAASSN